MRRCMTVVALGFAAGFLAVVLFHQPLSGLFHVLGVSPNAPYAMQANPQGVPRVISLAFWGGVWGIVFALLRPYLSARAWAFLLAGLVFGALAPTFFGRFVLTPLRGQPIATLEFANLWRGLALNGAWGFGTAVLLLVADRCLGRR